MSPAPYPAGRRLWGITAYFNPTGSSRRLENYRIFRRELRVPLVTVELAYGPGFELAVAEADIMIRLRGRDVLWQKERLLNLALRALPAECEAVAWLDADIVFGRPDWPELALAALEDCELVQPFREVCDADRDQPGSLAAPRQSLVARVVDGMRAPASIPAARLRGEFRCAIGLAWAARREILDRHGLYDAAIVGGADRLIAGAAYGAWEGLETGHRMNPRQFAHYLEWARPFFDSVRGRVGCVNGAISPQLHGSITNRAYGSRHTGLAALGFDPAADIALDEQGCWRWNSDKPGLHEYVRSYFERRGD